MPMVCMIEGHVFISLTDTFRNSESVIEREPISNVSKWDPRRRKRGDSTAPADTIPTGRCLIPLFFLLLFGRTLPTEMRPMT
jgi:hypothetical protein